VDSGLMGAIRLVATGSKYRKRQASLQVCNETGVTSESVLTADPGGINWVPVNPLVG